MSDSGNKAVFLSYASQDAEAVARLAEALRAAGVEVWFDQNELVGGDAWDAKIRKQIAACALFVPVISAATQARREGYFRLEWRLAAQRTHMMSESVAFLLPVVIDATRDAEADVPAEFKAVQWTRLRQGFGGQALGAEVEAFGGRVRTLLFGSAVGGALRPDEVSRPKPSGRKAPPTTGRRVAAVLAALAVLAAGAVWWGRPRAVAVVPASGEKAAEKAVAVLVFENRSEEKADDSFSEGISEELAVVLGKVPGLRVAGWASVMAVKNASLSDAEIARRLGVSYIVSGSVQRSGTQLRITARLVNAADGFQLWSERLQRDAKEIFALQDEIAGLIAQNLQLKLGLAARRERQVDPEAHRLLLEGRHFANRRNDEGFARAEASFRQALALDPGFADAQSGIASVHALRATFRQLPENAPEVLEDLRLARVAAERAVTLDGTLAEAHAILAYTRFKQGEAAAARQGFEQALAMNPNSVTTVLWATVLHTAEGRLDEMVRGFARVEQLDPLSFIGLHLYAEALFFAGRHADALRVAERAAQLRPDIYIPNLGLRAQLLFMLGRRAEALAAARQVRANPQIDTRWSGDAAAVWVLRQGGESREAGEYAAEALARLAPNSQTRAQIHAAQGNLAAASETLPGTKNTEYRYLYWEPMWDALRDDPRFVAALEKMGLTERHRVARETWAKLQREGAGAR